MLISCHTTARIALFPFKPFGLSDRFDFQEARPEAKPEARPEVETNANVFVMLRTTGDILQLPKELLMDKSLRREVTPCASHSFSGQEIPDIANRALLPYLENLD